MCSFLSGRSQKVVLGECGIGLLPLKCGVPQGLALSWNKHLDLDPNSTTPHTDTILLCFLRGLAPLPSRIYPLTSFIIKWINAIFIYEWKNNILENKVNIITMSAKPVATTLHIFWAIIYRNPISNGSQMLSVKYMDRFLQAFIFLCFLFLLLLLFCSTLLYLPNLVYRGSPVRHTWIILLNLSWNVIQCLLTVQWHSTLSVVNLFYMTGSCKMKRIKFNAFFEIYKS